MDGISKFLTSIAAILSAVAWPLAVLALAFIFKPELKTMLMQLSLVVKKVNKAAFAGLSFELDRIVEEEATASSDKSGQITSNQVESAARIKMQAKNIAPQAIFDEIDALGMQYDALRRTLPSGTERTRAMANIVVKMRSLAPSAVGNLELYKKSDLSGLRLAAIAIMQMVPKAADLDWLLASFSKDQPFLFYHSSLALQRLYDIADNQQEKTRVSEIASKSLQSVKSFKGTPDSNTIDVLEGILNENR